mgnify:CR=1 FL=1
MKRFVFILSFVFAVFFANTTFASTTENSVVNEATQITLADSNSELAEVDNAVFRDIYIFIFDDGTIIIVIVD